jgi:hypothetical protein
MGVWMDVDNGKPQRRPGRAGQPGVGEFEWDILTNAWWWSDALCHLYGYEPEAAKPSLRTFLRHKDPRDRARIDAVFNRCLAKGGPFSCYHRIIDARGRGRTVVVVGDGIRDAEDTRTVLMHGFMVDVTASVQREASAALQAALTNRAAIEQVKGALMAVHSLDADAAFAVLRGYSQVADKKVSALAEGAVIAFGERGDADGITRSELDQMLWNAAHQH